MAKCVKRLSSLIKVIYERKHLNMRETIPSVPFHWARTQHSMYHRKHVNWIPLFSRHFISFVISAFFQLLHRWTRTYQLLLEWTPSIWNFVIHWNVREFHIPNQLETFVLLMAVAERLSWSIVGWLLILSTSTICPFRQTVKPYDTMNTNEHLRIRGWYFLAFMMLQFEVHEMCELKITKKLKR